MKNQSRTNQELLEEISALKQKIQELEHSESGHKQAEDKLRESEVKLQVIFNSIGTGILVVDKKTQVIIEANNAAMEMTGLPKERIIGHVCHSLVCPAEVGKCPVKDLGQFVEHSERKLIHADGHRIDILKTVYPITIMGKDCYLESFIDISDRMRSKEALKESEEKYRIHFENASDIIFSYDREFLILSISPSVERVLGYKPEEFIGKSFTELNIMPPEDLEKAFSDAMRVFAGERLDARSYTFIARDGTRKYGEINSAPFFHKGQVVAVICAARDITERRQVEEKLLQTLENLRKSFGTTIQVMVSAVETRDPYTSGHQIRSANIARAIATEMGLPQETIDGIRMAGSIHDIGKLSIPAEILSRPGKLSQLEFSLIKEHARKGYEMLKDVESSWPLAQIVYQHHERMDGSGYPRNLKEDEILMEARILAVADVVESMASHRPYRAALGINAALEEIEKNRETLYDEM